MSNTRRRPAPRAAALTVSALLACVGLGTAAAPPAMAVPSTPCAPGTPLETDFDGDGLAELVVGALPWSSESSPARHWIQPGNGAAAMWVSDGALNAADLNGDVCADALVFDGGHHPWLKAVLGTPDGLDLDGATPVTIPQAAAVEADHDVDEVLVFHADSLRHDGFSQIVVSGHHMWEDDDHFAFIDFLTLDASLAVTHTQAIDYPGMEDWMVDFGSLATAGATAAIGVPRAAPGGHTRAGAVWLYTPDATNPAEMVRRKVLSQNSPGVPGSAEKDDRFGSTLAMRDGRLAIGVPGESVGRISWAGLVQPILWKEATHTYTAYRSITQDTSGVPDKNESDDMFGARLAVARGLTASGSYDILIGALESYGKWEDTGSVTVANFSRSLYRTYTQATSGIPGNPQPDDDFDVVGTIQSASGADTVLIGAPGEDTNGKDNVGRVVRSDGSRLTSKTVWSNVPIPSDAPGDMFCWGLAVGAVGD